MHSQPNIKNCNFGCLLPIECDDCVCMYVCLYMYDCFVLQCERIHLYWIKELHYILAVVQYLPFLTWVLGSCTFGNEIFLEKYLFILFIIYDGGSCQGKWPGVIKKFWNTVTQKGNYLNWIGIHHLSKH